VLFFQALWRSAFGRKVILKGVEMSAASLEAATPLPPRSKLRIAVIILALIKTVSSLSGLAGGVAAISEYAGNGFGQWLLFAGVAIFPILALAALIFAFKGDVGRAIMALAAIVIVGFLTDGIPSLFVHGLELSGSATVTLYYLAQLVVFPLLAVVAFVLARRNEKLVLAAILVCLPTVANILAVIGFAIGVSIHGF
jgi:hypothetical protein